MTDHLEDQLRAAFLARTESITTETLTLTRPDFAQALNSDAGQSGSTMGQLVHSDRGESHSPARRHRALKQWAAPLLAAAAVVAVAIAAPTLMHSGGGRAAPATDGATEVTAAPTPGPTSPDTPTPDTPTLAATPEPATPSATLAPAVTTTPLALGGATFSVPTGWAVQFADTNVAQTPDKWCVAPAKPGGDGACSLNISSYTRSDQMDLTINSIGGSGDIGECLPSGYQGAKGLQSAAIRVIGGRSAEYRTWRYDCRGDVTYYAEYLVPTFPAYVFWTETHTQADVTGLDVIASSAVLPAQSRPLALSDYGRVTAVSTKAGVMTVTLDRLAFSSDGDVDEHLSETYVVPAKVVTQVLAGVHVTVGTKLSVTSDGNTVNGAFLN